jgi:putative ABC transport system permease protein
MFERVAELWREARHSVRFLKKNPGFTIIVSTTLALGIGATTAIFSVLYATALAPLPYFDSERLVFIHQDNNQGQRRNLPVDMVEAWRKNSTTLESVSTALIGGVNATVSGTNGAERIRLEQVDFHTLEVFGVKPLLGRWFQPDEVIVQGNVAQTTVISYGLWQRVFGGDPNVIGKKLPGWTAGWGETVIGVMPKGFYTQPAASNIDAWYIITKLPGPVVGRLKRGATPRQAEAELTLLEWKDYISKNARDGNITWTLHVTPLQEVYRAGYARTVYMLLGAVAFVLLIASVNVANLQLNRGVKRQAEMATRTALGAGRWRLFRQLLIENVTVTLFGGVLGLAVALEGIRLFILLAPNFYPPSDEISVNGPVMLFTLGVCLISGILSGLVPGFRGSNPDLSASLKEGGRGVVARARLGIRRALVVAELALAMVLLVGAGLMIQSYTRLMGTSMGLDPENVLTMQVNLFGMDRYRLRHASNHYSATPEISNFYAKATDRLALLPGVQSVASTSNLPPRFGSILPFRIVGKPTAGGDAGPQTAYYEVSPGFFQTMRIPLLRGRSFTDIDNENAPGVAIVSEALAQQYFGDDDPIGQSILADMNSQNPRLPGDRVRQIVGVVRDIRMDFRSESMPTVYVPDRQNLTDYQSNGNLGIHAIHDFVIRTSSNPTRLAAAVRKAFADADVSVAVTDIMPMRERLSQLAGDQEFWMRLLGIFAGLGMFLAAIGVYGVISYTVEQRTHEFGIRATLGAQDSDILRLVLREGLVVTLIGLVIGVGGAYGATRLLTNQLFGVTPMDPDTIGAVALVLIVVAFLACYIPGRRATKLDPLSALRME